MGVGITLIEYELILVISAKIPLPIKSSPWLLGVRNSTNSTHIVRTQFNPNTFPLWILQILCLWFIFFFLYQYLIDPAVFVQSLFFLLGMGLAPLSTSVNHTHVGLLVEFTWLHWDSTDKLHCLTLNRWRIFHMFSLWWFSLQPPVVCRHVYTDGYSNEHPKRNPLRISRSFCAVLPLCAAFSFIFSAWVLAAFVSTDAKLFSQLNNIANPGLGFSMSLNCDLKIFQFIMWDNVSLIFFFFSFILWITIWGASSPKSENFSVHIFGYIFSCLRWEGKFDYFTLTRSQNRPFLRIMSFKYEFCSPAQM